MSGWVSLEFASTVDVFAKRDEGRDERAGVTGATDLSNGTKAAE